MAKTEDVLRMVAAGYHTGREIADALEVERVSVVNMPLSRLVDRGILKNEPKVIDGRMTNYYTLTAKPYTPRPRMKYLRVIKDLRQMIEDLIDDPAADTTLRAKKLLRETEQ